MNETIVQPLKSTASFKSYAKVWWETNLILLFSVGIMLPWSILKRRKYFYQHVTLNDLPFAFSARPKSMFIGVWFGIGLWVLLNYLFEYLPLPHDTFIQITAASLLFYLLACPLLAYFADQALTFRRYYSSYCGINFSFDRHYREALRCMFGFFVLSPMTLFILYPYFKWRFFKFRFARTAFGGIPLQYDAVPKDFFLVYLKLLLIGVLPFFILLSPIVLISWIWSEYLFEFFVLLNKYLLNIDSIAGMDETLQAIIRGAAKMMLYPYFFLLSIPIFIGLAYINTAVANINWNAISIDRIIFASNADFRKLLWIRISNFALIIFSMGLLIPLAKVRTIQFWTTSKSYMGDPHQLTLKAKAQDTISALGEGISDISGLDIGI